MKIDTDSISQGSLKGIGTWVSKGGEYFFENQYLKSKKSSDKEYILYSPLSEVKLLSDFIKIEETSQILEYCDNYGYLGFANTYTAEEHKRIDSGETFGNEVNLIKLHVTAIKYCLEILRIFNENCMADAECKRYLGSRRICMNDNPACIECENSKKMKLEYDNFPEEYDGLLECILPVLPAYNDTRGFGFMNAMNNDCANSLSIVSRLINSNLIGLDLSYNFDEKGKLRAYYRGKCLIDFIWYELAQKVSFQMKKCEWCGEWFTPRRSDARFCPPMFGRNYSKCHPSYRKKIKGYRKQET